MSSLVFVLIFVTACSVVHGDIFASIHDLEQLANVEEVVIEEINLYIELQEKFVHYLKTKLKEYQKEHERFKSSPQKYLANPLNSFAIIKRLTLNKNHFAELPSIGEIEFLDRVDAVTDDIELSEEDDMQGAAVGIGRLQEMFHLDASELSKGIIDGVKYRDELSSSDCYEIAHWMSENLDFKLSQTWLNESLKRFNPKTDSWDIKKVKILELAAKNLKNLGNLEIAQKFVGNLIKDFPTENVFKEILAEIEEQYPIYLNGTLELTTKKPPTRENILHGKSCRDELQRSPAELSGLKCYYVTNTSAFVRLAAIKLEEVNRDPYVAVFHDVMYDNDIAIIKEMSRDHFIRSGTYSDDTTIEEKRTYYRVSKVAWLPDETHERIKTISQRTEDMTGLTTSSAEALQTQNYGIGGHYDCHVDYLRNKTSPTMGDRIATVLFYLTDVEKGGATVFPYLKIHVKPEKGKAVFWYNLAPCGNPEWMTRHSSCPVLVGTKWASNKWIHEVGQEFRRPCGMAPKITEVNYEPFYIGL